MTTAVPTPNLQETEGLGVTTLVACCILALPFCYLHGIVEGNTLPRWLLIQTLCLAVLLRGQHFFPTLKSWLLLGLCMLPSLSISQDYGFTAIGLSKAVIAFQCLLLGFHLVKQPQRYHAAIFISATMVALLGLIQVHSAFDFYPQAAAPAASFVNRNVAAQFMVGAVMLGLPTLKRHSALLLPFSLQIGYILSCQSRGAVLAIFMAMVLIIGVREAPALRTLPFSLKSFLPKAIICLAIALMLQDQPLQTAQLFMGRIFSYSPIWLPLLGLALIAPILWPHIKKFKLPLAILAVLGFAVAAIAIPQSASVQRWLDQVNPETDLNTANVRIALYANSLAMIADNPLRGHGPGQFPLVYPLYNDALLPTPSLNHRTLPQHLHQDFLQTAVDFGLPALLLLLFTITASIQALLKRDTLKDPTIASILAILAMSFHGMVSFPLGQPASAFLFWIALGSLLATWNPQGYFKKGNQPISRVLLIVINLMGLGFMLLQGLSSHLLLESHRYLQEENVREAYVYATHADRIFPYNGKALDQAVTILTTHAPGKQTTRAVIDQFIKRYPNHPNGHYRLAYELGQTGQYDEAFKAIEEVKRLAATDAEVYLLEGILHRRMGNREKALEAFNECLRLHPNHSGARWELRTL